VTTPVQLLRYKDSNELPTALTEIAADHGIPRERIIVLAHAEKTAPTSAGGNKDHKVGNHKLARIAAAFYQLSDESRGPLARSKALTNVGLLLRELGDNELSHDAYLEQIGLTDREFKDACLRLGTATPNPYAQLPSALKAALHAAEESQQMLGWKPQGLRNLPNDTWPERPAASTSVLPYSTVHAFKGLQEDCVALVIPKPSNGRQQTGLAQWTNQTEGEERRVLSVGASRAKRVLILAVHQSHHETLRSNLTRDRVPFEDM
jgi:DNA helicase-2/ATP-dependent DNA helicase PcrA